MDDFNFYLKFAKPLVLNLPDAKDRTIAALWVKKLSEMQSDGPEANMRIEYLKLLLFVMQRNKLAGIFEKAPPEDNLQDFPTNHKATDMLFLVKPAKSAAVAYPPVFTSVGGDLCQFVAVQEIPNFGLHGYYAISVEPLSKWSHANTNAAKNATAKPKHYADCFKDSCKLVESTYCMKKSDDPGSPPQSPAHRQQPDNSENLNPSANSRQRNECEKIPMAKFTQLPPIPFQSFRKEIAGFESRPTWGRSRYIERLIDESPHMTADLDVSQADAMLHGMSNITFKKTEHHGPCAISSTRQHVERMFDLPPCAVDPGEINPTSGMSYTCRPKRERALETQCTDICLSERDFYPCGKKSGLSLRGGSDSGSCCGAKNRGSRSRGRSSSDSGRDRDDINHNRRYHTPPGLPRPGLKNEANRNGSIFDDTDDPLDVDTSIHNITTARTYIDPDTSGNFKWLEDMEHVHFSDPADTSCTEFDSGSRMKPFSSDTMTYEFNYPETEGCFEFDEESSINEQLQTKDLMPQVARRLQFSKLCRSQRSPPSQQPPCQDYWERQTGPKRSNCTTAIEEDDSGEEDVEPSMAVVRRRFAKSREATKHSPEMHEASYRWKEIIDQTKPSRDGNLRSEDPRRMSSRDLEYLEYLEATKTDCGSCYEDDDNEEIDAARYSRRVTGQTCEGDETRYVKQLLRPPKAIPSPGKVTMPLSKQSIRRQMTERMQYKEPSIVTMVEDKSKVNN